MSKKNLSHGSTGMSSMYLRRTCILTRHACTYGLPPTQRPSNIHSRDGAEYTPLYYLLAEKLLSFCIDPRLTGICRHKRWHGTLEMIVARRDTLLFWWSQGGMNRCRWREASALHAAFENSGPPTSPKPAALLQQLRHHEARSCRRMLQNRTENLISGEPKRREDEKNRHNA